MYIITNYAAIAFITNKTDIVYLLTAVCCIIIIIFLLIFMSYMSYWQVAALVSPHQRISIMEV